MRNAMRQGFTLLEMLVTLILLGILVAVVFPVVVQQIDDADPTKAANDLANIRTGIEIFHLNVRPTYPGDLEDLVHAVSSSVDTYILATNGTKTAYNAGQETRWNGPYIDASIQIGGAIIGDVVETGFGGQIQGELLAYDATNNCFQGGTCVGTYTNPEFVAVVIHDLDATQAQKVNDLIDGSNESAWQDQGKIRFSPGATDDTYYLAVPIK